MNERYGMETRSYMAIETWDKREDSDERIHGFSLCENARDSSSELEVDLGEGHGWGLPTSCLESIVTDNNTVIP